MISKSKDKISQSIMYQQQSFHQPHQPYQSHQLHQPHNKSRLDNSVSKGTNRN